MKKKLSRRFQQKLVLAVCGLVALLAAAAATWMFLLSGQGGTETTTADTRELVQVARPHAEAVAGFFDSISSDLASYAASDRVKSLFQDGDDAALDSEADAATPGFPSALKLRLLRPGQFQADNDSSPPLSFGSIAILNKAERTAGAIAAEVLLFGTENQHIVMVERVKNQSDQLLGVVHLSLDVDLFQQALEQLGNTQGYVEIMQTSVGNPLVLGSAGDPDIKTGEPGTASISGTRWTLAYWDQPAMVTPEILSSGFGSIVVIGAVVAILVLLMLVFLVFRGKTSSVKAVLERPGVTYAGAIKAIMEGAHPGMEKLIANMPGGTGTPTHTSGLSEGLEGADITSFMDKNKLKAATAGEVMDITAGGKETGGEQPPREPPRAPEPAKPVPEKTSARAEDKDNDVIPKLIFRKYDIRGIVDKSLTDKVVYKIGLAIGSEAQDRNQKDIVVGRDGRLSSPALCKGLIKGLTEAGVNVIDIGIVPTPVLYFATHHLETGSGVMLTGSHNGPEYNGLKIVLGGTTLSEESINALYDRIVAGNFSSGSGEVSSAEVVPEYIRKITEDIPVAFGSSFKIIIDCGNGAASVAASQLYRAMGHDVVEMFCELDGNFPNHHPDPSQPENLEMLITKVREEQADIGFAFDGDGDRLGIVDSDGNVLWPDQQMMVFARDVLSRNQGAEIIFDVKCSVHLKRIIEESGGRPLMWKTGHSLIKSKMKEVNAPLAGEMSGHIFFAERWYGFDDALYSGARMLEILTNAKMKPVEFFADLPRSVSTPELRIDLPESEHEAIMSDLKTKISFDDAEVISVDGFRIEFSTGWGLIRPSNTTPCLIARFEADDEEALKEIQEKFRKLLADVRPDLSLPF